VTETKLLYHLLWMIIQYCSAEEKDEYYITRYNADANAVDDLAKEGYVEILDGEWPYTKRIKCKLTDKGKNIINKGE
jgi:hypothetical protein